MKQSEIAKTKIIVFFVNNRSNYISYGLLFVESSYYSLWVNKRNNIIYESVALEGFNCKNIREIGHFHQFRHKIQFQPNFYKTVSDARKQLHPFLCTRDPVLIQIHLSGGEVL